MHHERLTSAPRRLTPVDNGLITRGRVNYAFKYILESAAVGRFQFVCPAKLSRLSWPSSADVIKNCNLLSEKVTKIGRPIARRIIFTPIYIRVRTFSRVA